MRTEQVIEALTNQLNSKDEIIRSLLNKIDGLDARTGRLSEQLNGKDKTIRTLMKKVDTLTKSTDKLLGQLNGKDELIKALLEKSESLDNVAKEQAQTIKDLTSEIKKLQTMCFGTKSEKTKNKDKQDDDDSSGNNCNAASNNTTADKNAKVKHNYKRPERRDYSDIEDEQVVEIRPDEALIAGARLLKIASTYRIFYIPGRVVKIRYDRYIYHKDGHLITPPLPYAPETFEKRKLDPSLAAWILTAKFHYHLPYERVLKMINECSDIKIAKSTLFDWATAGIDALDGLYDAIREKVLSDWHLNVDETVQKLLNTDSHKCENVYDWGFISKTHKLMYFKTYIATDNSDLRNGSRGHQALDDEIKDFQGNIIQSDGYGAYGHVGARTKKEIENLFCMAHIRRKFWDCLSYHEIFSQEALDLINPMYSDEREYKLLGLSPESIIKRRRINLKPKLDKFRSWLYAKIKDKNFLEDSALGKAIIYAWQRIESFYLLLNNGELDLDNNLAERSMRGHTLGRKNYNYCRTPEATERTCKIYSIIESCKLSGIEPFKYLCEVLSREPKFGETWEDLLPCNIRLQ